MEIKITSSAFEDGGLIPLCQAKIPGCAHVCRYKPRLNRDRIETR